MNRINTELVIDLITSNISEVRGLIGNLLDYSDHISVIEEKMKCLDFHTKYGIYMAEQLDLQRREKHDIAILSLNKLNDVSLEQLGDKIYKGIIDDIHRSEIAQAIMIFSEEILDRVDIMDSDNV